MPKGIRGKPACEIDGCGQPNCARGWCKMHYSRWYEYGDPLTTPPTIEDRFWAKVNKRDDDGCWLWTATTDSTGYGKFRADGKLRLAHRWSYGYFVGPIPDGLTLDHLCRNRACVNPVHLEPVTLRENVMRSSSNPTAINARKTHCNHGHPLSGDNLAVRRGGTRACRACRKLRNGARGGAECLTT